jgi:hypothetical protein
MSTSDSQRYEIQRDRVNAIAMSVGLVEVYFGTMDRPDGIAFIGADADGRQCEFPESTSVSEVERMSDAQIAERIRSCMVPK